MAVWILLKEYVWNLLRILNGTISPVLVVLAPIETMSFKITKVKLLFLYRFSVLSVHLHYKLLSRGGGRARPRFYVLG